MAKQKCKLSSSKIDNKEFLFHNLLFILIIIISVKLQKYLQITCHLFKFISRATKKNYICTLFVQDLFKI